MFETPTESKSASHNTYFIFATIKRVVSVLYPTFVVLGALNQ